MTELKLVRVDSSGNSSKFSVKKWTYDSFANMYSSGEVPSDIAMADLITDADNGVLLGWKATIAHPHSDQPGDIIFRMTDATSQGVSESTVNIPTISTPIQPVLQQSDGTFVGVTYQGSISGDYMPVMIAFDWHGNVKWTLPGAYPSIATSDGGVIASLSNGGTVRVDNQGSIKKTIPMLPISSWRGSSYQYGSIDRIQADPFDLALSFWIASRANFSQNHAAVIRYQPPQEGLRRIAVSGPSSSSSCSDFLQNLTSIANQSGRLPANFVLTKERLISQLRATADEAQDYVYDGPSATVTWESCDVANCTAKFPVWIAGQPSSTTVGGWFKQGLSSHLALSQYSGSAVWLQLHDCADCISWDGKWRGLFSPFISGGHVNSYGIGLLMHELLHKKTVGGGFTHPEIDGALDIAPPPAGASHDFRGDIIGQRCFPE